MLRVRGAPAIGIAAAYGVIVGLKTVDDENEAAFFERFDYVLTYLAESRPTAVNLFWALDRMRQCGQQQKDAGSSCLLYTSPSPRDLSTSRMPSSA